VRTRLLAIYDADGGLLGEARYVVGTLLGRASCSLCDITHGHRLRAKAEWDHLVADLGVPLEVLHRNEADDLPIERLPCVLAEVDGSWHTVLGPDELAACEGDVDRFAVSLRARMAELR
jgi:hypothetical protein